MKAVVEEHKEISVIVEVAETVQPRENFTRQLLLGIIVPQLLLIGLGGLAVWAGVSRGLAPLRELETALVGRSSFDLSPVSDSSAPRECSRWSKRSTTCSIVCARISIRRGVLFLMPHINYVHPWPA